MKPFRFGEGEVSDRPGWSVSCQDRTWALLFTYSSARTSSVGETETAGPRRSPMTELLRRVFAGAESP